MKIKILEKKGDTWKFAVEDTTPAFANALRRIMITEVPTLAINDVDFYDNTSSLFDEVIAHRLGMVPLRFDPLKFEKGKKGPLGEVFFALEKKGPSTVYSGDLKSTDKSVKPTSPDFPIVQLLANHNIKLEAKAVLGLGKDHAKWQAANVTYVNEPFIEMKKPIKNLKHVVDSCPKGTIAIKNRKLVIVDPFKSDESKAIEEASDGAAVVKTKPNSFLFRVESISGLEPKYIISRSVQILQDKANDFRKEVGKLK